MSNKLDSIVSKFLEKTAQTKMSNTEANQIMSELLRDGLKYVPRVDTTYTNNDMLAMAFKSYVTEKDGIKNYEKAFNVVRALAHCKAISLNGATPVRDEIHKRHFLESLKKLVKDYDNRKIEEPSQASSEKQASTVSSPEIVGYTTPSLQNIISNLAQQSQGM